MKQSKGIRIPDKPINSCQFIFGVRIPCELFSARSRASLGMNRVLSGVARDGCTTVQNVVFTKHVGKPQDFKVGEVDLKIKLNKLIKQKQYRYFLSLTSNLLTQ